MITKQTVLILGAGVSRAYGFPLQIELKNEILLKLKDIKTRQALTESHGYSEFMIDNFASAFKKSGLDNIEQFLKERIEFEEIGKLVLAEIIISHEDIEVLFEPSDVYQYLYDVMNDSLEGFGKNELSIITFNFDRSLEIFLFEALKNSYGKKQQDIEMQLKQIPIFHVHGYIGNISKEGIATAADYGKKVSRQELVSIASKFTFDNLDSVINQARKVLEDSEVIAFIGFGYADNDLKLLDINSLEGKTVLGSTFNLKPGEIAAIAKRMNGKIVFPKTKVAQSLNGVEFLKESGVLGL